MCFRRVIVSYPAINGGASCLIAPPCLHTNPRDGRGGIGRSSTAGTLEGWHPPCTLQKNQRSVEVAVQGETTVGAEKHSVFQSQALVDSSTQETLT